MLSPFLIYIRLLFEIFILDFLAEKKKPLQFLKTVRVYGRLLIFGRIIEIIRLVPKVVLFNYFIGGDGYSRYEFIM